MLTFYNLNASGSAVEVKADGKGGGSWFCVGFFPEIQITLKSG